MKTGTKRILAVLLSVTVLAPYLLMPAEQTQTFAADNVLHSLNLWTSTGGHGSDGISQIDTRCSFLRQVIYVNGEEEWSLFSSKQDII